MPGIVEFPKPVQDAVTQYGHLFDNECQRRHFAEYLTGLIVAERKTVLEVHGEFADTTDQSCLNRFLTQAKWDVENLNEQRLELLQKDPSTRYSDQGVIPIDNTLIDRDGMLIPDAGWFWDHAEQRNKIAQDYLFVNYVCTSGKQCPFREPRGLLDRGSSESVRSANPGGCWIGAHRRHPTGNRGAAYRTRRKDDRFIRRAQAAHLSESNARQSHWARARDCLADGWHTLSSPWRPRRNRLLTYRRLLVHTHGRPTGPSFDADIPFLKANKQKHSYIVELGNPNVIRFNQDGTYFEFRVR